MKRETKKLKDEDEKFIRGMHEWLHWTALSYSDLADGLWKMFLVLQGSSTERIRDITNLLAPKKGKSCYYHDGEENVMLDWNEETVRSLLIFSSGSYGKMKRVKGKGYMSEFEMIEQAEKVMNDKAGVSDDIK